MLFCPNLPYHVALTNPFVFQGCSDSHAEHDDQMQVSQDAGGDTDLATNTEETQTTVTGAKRKSSGPASSVPRYVLRFSHCPLVLTVSTKLKRLRAIDPFESSSMAHAGATSLVDDWQTKIISPYGTASPWSLTLNLWTPDPNASLLSPTSSTTMISCVSTLSPFSVCDHIYCFSCINLLFTIQFEENLVPTFTLPRITRGVKVYPSKNSLRTFARTFAMNSSTLSSNRLLTRSYLGLTRMSTPSSACISSSTQHSLHD